MRTLRVFIVEDDLGVAQFNREFVASNPGFTVVDQAQSGTETVGLIDSLAPDVVLLAF